MGRQEDNTNKVFRVIMRSTCTHKQPIFHYKTQTDVCGQWEAYQVSTAKFEPSIGAISPVVDLHGQKKQYGEVDQLTLNMPNMQ